MSKEWEYAKHSAWTKQMGGPQKVMELVESMDDLDVIKEAAFQKGKMSILKKAPPVLLLAVGAGGLLVEGYHRLKQKKSNRDAEMQCIAEKAREAETRLRSQAHEETSCGNTPVVTESENLDAPKNNEGGQ